MKQAGMVHGARLLILWAAFAAAENTAAQVKIESPPKDTIVAEPVVYVSGTLVASNRNIGITVNDIAALIDLDHAGTKSDPFRWLAVLEPDAGPVKLKARLHVAGQGRDDKGKDDDGAASTLHIHFAPGPRTLSLRPARASGIAPLDVTFSANVENPADVAKFEIDYDGNGTWDRNAASIPEDLVRRYATPGITLVTARVTMKDGSVATAVTAVHAQSFRTVNALLKDVWSGFRRSLAGGDLDAVMTWFAADSVRDKYRRPLESIRPTLESFAAAIQTLDAVWIHGDIARYLATRIEDGRPTGYHVYFARDTNGLWKILQF